jgi:hypothetical protein
MTRGVTMSKNTEATKLEAGAANVRWDEEASTANAVYVKLTPLNEEQTTKGNYLSLDKGGSIEGILVGTGVNKYGKDEYKIQRFTDNKTLVIANAGNLKYKMTDKGINVGDAVRITYNGKTPMSSGKYKGTPAHNFTVAGEAAD